MNNSNLNVCGLISMILGIISLFVLPLWLGIASLILGVIGIATAGEVRGKGMAIAGVVLGATSLVWYFWLASIIISTVA